jgi:8-oxo-dGTP diphosphatase
MRLTVDAVVFGYESPSNISVLLVKRRFDPFQGHWAIPGGFVLDNESLEEAVKRELKEETGVKINYLEQLYTYGDIGRDPRGRVITVAYFGLVKSTEFHIMADTDAEDVEWFEMSQLPPLAFDHQHIIQKAYQRLQAKITYEPIGFELLDKKFLFSELENLYSTLLGRPVDRRNFRKKVLSFGILDELNEKVSEGRGRPASLFQFNVKRYRELKTSGFYFDL